MRGMKKALSFMTAVTIAASLIPAAFAADETTTVMKENFDNAAADWSFTLADAAADDDMIAVIDGISGMSVRYLDATSSSESSGITTAGSIVSADENKFLELASGHRATKTDYMPRLVIDGIPESDAETGMAVILSFKAMLQSNGSKTPVLGIGDEVSISTADSYGAVADEWQNYELTLSAGDNSLTIDIDGEKTTVNEIGITTFGDIYNAYTGSSTQLRNSGSILLDDIAVETVTFDNSPEGILDRYLNSIAPPAEIKKDLTLAGSNSTYEIIWSSSDESIIATDGKVTPGVEDKTVTLTVSGQEYMNPTNIATKEFEVVVKGIGDLSAEQREIELAMMELAQSEGEEYTPAVFDWDVVLPSAETSNGWVSTKWTSNNAIVKIFDGVAKIQPPVEEETAVTLTARVYCTRDASIYNEKQYVVYIAAGAGEYTYDVLEVYADIDFEEVDDTTMVLSTTTPDPIAVNGDGYLKFRGNRSSGADGTTSISIGSSTGADSRVMIITNGTFASNSRNGYFEFANTPEFANMDDKTVLLSFKLKMKSGSNGEPVLRINNTLNYTAEELGITVNTDSYSDEITVELYASDEQNRLVTVTRDADGNILKMMDSSLQIDAFTTIENQSAVNNGSIIIDDIHLAVYDTLFGKTDINVGISGATVEVKDTGLSVKTGTNGTASFYLPKGLYNITASCPLYHTKTMELSASGSDASYSLTLEKKDTASLIDSFTEALELVYADQSSIPVMNERYVFSSDIAAKTTEDSELFKVSFALKDASAAPADGSEPNDTPAEEDTLPERLSEMLSGDGSVTPLYSYDTTATVVATVTASGIEPRTKEFAVTIKNIKEYMSDAAAALVADGIYSGGANAAETPAVGSLELPKLGEGYGDLTVSWKSQSEYVSDEGTIVKAPETEETAVITAVVTYSKNGRSYNLEQNFEVKLASKAVMESNLSAELDKLDIETSFTSVDTKNEIVNLTKFVSEDFYLPKTSTQSNIVYSWMSDNDVLVIENTNEACIARFHPRKDDDRDSKVGVVANLVVEASYMSGPSVLATVKRTIPVSTKFDESKDGKYKVRGDAEYKENFAVTYNGKTRYIIDDLTTIDQKISDIKTEGYFGAKISWDSSSALLKITSTKITPTISTNEVEVKLTVKVYDENSSESADAKEVKLTIRGDSSVGSGGGGGGGSSSGSSSNTIIGGVTGSETVSGGSQFTDLDSTEWAREAVEALAAKGVVSGKQNGIFAPNDNVTRAEFAQMLIKAMNLTDANAAVDVFEDVNYGDWYYTSVATAYNEGIIAGHDNGTFGVSDNITRQDMAAIAYRAADVGGISLYDEREMSFADAQSIAGYAFDAVMALANAGIINGMTDTEFMPQGTATRAQAAVIIYNLIK